MNYILICIIVIFYVTFITKAILLKLQGVSVIRLGRGKKQNHTRGIELICAVFNFLMPFVLVVSILFYDRLIIVLPQLPVFGTIVALVGVIYFILAVVVISTSWRIGIDTSQQTTLITKGIYRLSRNPAYVGFDLLYIGSSLVFPTLLLITFTIISILLFHLIIREEEKYLTNKFGKEYEIYKKNTMRY